MKKITYIDEDGFYKRAWLNESDLQPVTISDKACTAIVIGGFIFILKLVGPLLFL